MVTEAGSEGKKREKQKWLLYGPAVVLGFYVAVLFILMISGIKLYIVMSGSMEPYIPTGSLCLVNRNVEYDEIEVGDVIAFETAGGVLVTHRVINISEEGMETKGDANDVSDGFTTTYSNFRGKTVGAIPYLGYFYYLVSGKKGKMACVTVLFLVICVSKLSELMRE